MVRDELMQAVVSGEQEPITPFTLQAGNLYEKQGISIILVAGSSGAYFYIDRKTSKHHWQKAKQIQSQNKQRLELKKAKPYV